MAHFLKMTDDDTGNEVYINLDFIVKVDVNECSITLSLGDGDVYYFDGDTSNAEWRQVMKFINEHKIY